MFVYFSGRPGRTGQPCQGVGPGPGDVDRLAGRCGHGGRSFRAQRLYAVQSNLRQQRVRRGLSLRSRDRVTVGVDLLGQGVGQRKEAARLIQRRQASGVQAGVFFLDLSVGIFRRLGPGL